MELKAEIENRLHDFCTKAERAKALLNYNDKNYQVRLNVINEYKARASELSWVLLLMEKNSDPAPPLQQAPCKAQGGQKRRNMNIPKEHQLECKGCGKILDMRYPSVLCHGWIEDGKIVCYDDSGEPIPYSSSRKVGQPIQWTKDKKQIDLN